MAAPTAQSRYWWGNYQIAKDIVKGGVKAHLLIIGDSLQGATAGGLPTAYLRSWRVPVWSGICGQMGADFAYNGSYYDRNFVDVVERAPGAAAGPGTMTGYSPRTTYNAAFIDSEVVGAGDDEANRFIWHDADLSNSHATFLPGGSFLNGQAYTARLITVKNPDGEDGLRICLKYETKVGGGANYEYVDDWSAYRATTKMVADDYTIAASSMTRSGPMIKGYPAATYDSAKNVIYVTTRSYLPSVTGFQLDLIQEGGVTPAHFIDDEHMTATAWADYLDLTDCTHIMIWLGANNSETFLTDMDSFLARLRAAKPGVKFILIAQYDLYNQTDSLSAQLEGYKTRAAAANDIFVVDLFNYCGGFATLEWEYRITKDDRVHPATYTDTTAGWGKMFLAQSVWAQLCAASAHRPGGRTAAGLGL